MSPNAPCFPQADSWQMFDHGNEKAVDTVSHCLFVGCGITCSQSVLLNRKIPDELQLLPCLPAATTAAFLWTIISLSTSLQDSPSQWKSRWDRELILSILALNHHYYKTDNETNKHECTLAIRYSDFWKHCVHRHLQMCMHAYMCTYVAVRGWLPLWVPRHCPPLL